jgi:hypothetical protein
METIARGTALTLQSVILQALVYEGAMTPAEALEAVDKALAVSWAGKGHGGARRRAGHGRGVGGGA